MGLRSCSISKLPLRIENLKGDPKGGIKLKKNRDVRSLK